MALNQEKIVLLIAFALFCVFSFFLRGFLSPGNLLTLLRSVSTLGILGVGMALVVIGRGIDLSIVAIYAMSAAWTLHLADTGASIPVALALGYLYALAIGVANGLLIAYLEIPALFATLGMAAFAYGFARFFLVPLYVVYLPPSASGLAWIGGGFIFGVPAPILFLLWSRFSASPSCVTRTRAGSSTRSATISPRRGSLALRCARPSSCNMRSPRRSPTWPA